MPSGMRANLLPFAAIALLLISSQGTFADGAAFDGVWQGEMMPATQPLARDLGFRGNASYFCVSLNSKSKLAVFAFPSGTKSYTAVFEAAGDRFHIRVGRSIIGVVDLPRPMFGRMFARIKRPKGNEVETIGSDLMKRAEASPAACLSALAK